MQQNYDVVHTLDQTPARNSCLAGNTIARCLNCSSVLNNSSSSCSDVIPSVLQLIGGSTVLVQVCGRSFQVVNASSCRQPAPYAVAIGAVDGNLGNDCGKRHCEIGSARDVRADVRGSRLCHHYSKHHLCT